jgi:hypothetical protein
MSRKSLPVIGLSIMLLIALMTAGVAYGLWSKNLVLNGTVNTGSVDASFSLEEVDESGDFNDFCPSGGFSIGKDCDGDGELNDHMEVEGKDVGSCEAVMLDAYTMQVTVNGAYPQYNCFVRYNVENTGSIPLKLFGPDYFYEGVYSGRAINTSALHANIWPYDCFDDGVQLHTGDAAFCNLHISIYQAAEMDQEYSFLVKFFARQWNEAVMPPWR